MVGTYFDSALLIKNYVAEPNSSDAQDLLERETPPLPLTHLQEAEIRNGIRLKTFRKEITQAEAAGALLLLEDDIRAGRLERPNYTLLSIFHRAEILSERYAMATGARTLDILHVAAAVELRCRRFVSFDERQRKVAAKAGLRVLPR
ncbi:MAG: type II toxin-antitoxin system VapC family toxin [Verrucomicrobiota bacterium]